MTTDPNPVSADDREWWDAYGMCGGCGSADCHDGPCSEVASVEPFYGFRLTVCGRCPTRQAEGAAPALHIVPTGDAIDHDTAGDCWCGPAHLTERGQIIAAHHAADGRDRWANVKWPEAMWFANAMARQARVRYRVWRDRFGWVWGPTERSAS